MNKYILAGMITTAVFCLSALRKKDDFSPAIGVCTAPDKASMLKEGGYDYIEAGVGNLLVPTEPEEVFEQKLALIRAAGIPVYACNSFIPGTLKSVGPEAVHDSILRYAEIAFRRAQKAGVRTIVFGSGASRRCPEGFDKKKAVEQFVTLLKKMSPVAAKYNVVISIEVLNSRETNLINRLAEGVEVVKAVNHPNCRLLADFYHMAVEGDAPEEIIKAGKYLYHCHIGEKEKRTVPGIMGDDFTPYFKALRKIKYKGNISVEADWGNDMKKQLPLTLEVIKQQIASSK